MSHGRMRKEDLEAAKRAAEAAKEQREATPIELWAVSARRHAVQRFGPFLPHDGTYIHLSPDAPLGVSEEQWRALEDCGSIGDDVELGAIRPAITKEEIPEVLAAAHAALKERGRAHERAKKQAEMDDAARAGAARAARQALIGGA